MTRSSKGKGERKVEIYTSGGAKFTELTSRDSAKAANDQVVLLLAVLLGCCLSPDESQQ